MKDLAKLSELELGEVEIDTPKSLKELNSIIKTLESRPHDYGTCVYAMSIAAYATFEYMASKLGVTGFQASCADMDFISRTRRMKKGFRIIDYENALYPQYCDKEHFPSWEDVIKDHKEMFLEAAKEKLANTEYVCNEVLDHWKKVAKMCEDFIAEDESKNNKS